MIKRTKAICATFILAGTLGSAVPAMAEDEGFLGGTISANVSMLNDYRFRGVSLNDEGFALQGGIDWGHESGFYVGTWASNISDFNGSTVETDFYAGYAGEIEGISYDIGGLLYHYPGGTSTDYFEIYGSTGMDLGFASATVGANYAFSSDNLGNEDNIYIYTAAEVAVPNTPVTLDFLLGYEDGAFAAKKWDWRVGATVSYSGLDFSVAYIDTNIDNDNSDARAVFSVGASF